MNGETWFFRSPLSGYVSGWRSPSDTHQGRQNVERLVDLLQTSVNPAPDAHQIAAPCLAVEGS
jgi:hypothetical protein